MRDNFEDRRIPAEKSPAFGPEGMLKMMLVFEQVCADNNISRASTELRGTLALAIIRAGARSHDLAELKGAALAAIGISPSPNGAYDLAHAGHTQ